MSGKDRQASFGAFADQALEAITLWTEANQQVTREMTDFTLSAAAEGIRVAGEVQSTLAQSAGRLQDGVKEASGKIRELYQAMIEPQRLSSPTRS